MSNFHQKPFDEATLVTLDLFRKYIREWLPVFLNIKSGPERITIVDFFAGPGRDTSGEAGSPLIAIEEIRKYSALIRESSSNVHLELNEKAKAKANKLRAILDAEQIAPSLCSWKVESQTFEDAFERLRPMLRSGSSLLLLDQQGVKFISDKVFHTLAGFPKTDFIFFMASSSLRRFESHPNIRRHLSIPEGTVTAKGFNDAHRAVADYYRKLATNKVAGQLFLASFSIKKGSNIYGLIFGSQHPLGIEKFLRLCWKIDPLRGEANFDIDGERIDTATPSLFSELDVPKKLQVFQSQLEKRIISGELTTDRSVYIATLESGFLPVHGREVLNNQIKAGKIRCPLRPRVSKDGYKDPRRLTIIPQRSECNRSRGTGPAKPSSGRQE